MLVLFFAGVADAATQPSPTGLKRQQLKAEIAKVEHETRQLEDEEGLIGDIVRLAPLITVLVALGGLIATLLKQITETNRQRQLDREERSKARVQRLDEQFQQIVVNLSSPNGEVRAAAAASIEMFMRPEYAEVHRRLFLLLLGALRFPRGDISDRLLVRTFQQVAREQVSAMRRDGAAVELDLSSCYLAQVRLDSMDLSSADIAFANLHGAELSDTSLRRARGIKVNLSGARMSGSDLGEARLVEAVLIKSRMPNANLVSTKLQRANATAANFRGARMQEAQLDGAVLRGAQFEGANVNNGYFRGAAFDEGALRSIASGATNWREANWDEEIRQALEALSSDAAS